MLLRFQRSRIIETEESQELEDKVNFQEMLQNPNPSVSLIALLTVRERFCRLASGGCEMTPIMKNFIEGLYLVRPKSVDHSSRQHLEKNLKKGIRIMGKMWKANPDKKQAETPTIPNMSEE